MTYNPQVNDYVVWTNRNHIQGWIYHKNSEYITIETSVKPKDPLDYQASPIHANNRLLIICYENQWKNLKYIKSRSSKYESDHNLT